MRSETTLLEIQRRFMRAIREPIHGESRERTELPSRSGGVSSSFVETADDLITPSQSLKPIERLELYHRQYWYRLLESIEEDFPGLRLLLGDLPFWGLIESYLEEVPSTSFTLRHLGRGLADFIADHPGIVPHSVHAEDLARLEYALMEAFEAAEHDPVPAERLSHARLGLQPHLHLLALRTPADEIWRRADEEEPLGDLEPATDDPSRFVAVFRQDLRLQVEAIDREAYEILTAMERTSSLDDAMEIIASDEVLTRELDGPRVSEWFSAWVGRGWLIEKRSSS